MQVKLTQMGRDLKELSTSMWNFENGLLDRNIEPIKVAGLLSQSRREKEVGDSFGT